MDLCLMFAILLGTVALCFALLLAYCWWADDDPLLLGDDMGKMLTATEAKTQLATAQCPPALSDKLVGGSFWTVIQTVLAFLAAHPGLEADIWALVQDLLAGGALPAG